MSEVFEIYEELFPGDKEVDVEHDRFEDLSLEDAESDVEMFMDLVRVGRILVDAAYRCPLALNAAWRRSVEFKQYNDVFTVCKGNANGFDDRASLYQHFSTKVKCPYHAALAKWWSELYGEEISHVASASSRAKAIGSAKTLPKEEGDKEIEYLSNGLKMGPKNSMTMIIWPPMIVIRKLGNDFNSKNKILNTFERFKPLKAAPIYAPNFAGDVLIQFVDSPLGYFRALELINYVNSPKKSPIIRGATASYVTEAEIVKFERIQATKKIVMNYKKGTYDYFVKKRVTSRLQKLKEGTAKLSMKPKVLQGTTAPLSSNATDENSYEWVEEASTISGMSSQVKQTNEPRKVVDPFGGSDDDDDDDLEGLINAKKIQNNGSNMTDSIYM